jgi:hypothetical protein
MKNLIIILIFNNFTWETTQFEDPYSSMDNRRRSYGASSNAMKRHFEFTVAEDTISGRTCVYVCLPMMSLWTNELRIVLATWAFPGYGVAETMVIPEAEIIGIRQKMQRPKHLLSEWPSTAISGNDLLSSCLYSAGIVASKAGKLAPIPTVMVAATMYLFRFIYLEVVSAIPLNGGSYNTMLNTTSKRVAAMTAALAVIAYLATGVVGAVSASDYLHSQAPFISNVSSAIVILFVFALLNLVGISESSVIYTLPKCHKKLFVIFFIHDKDDLKDDSYGGSYEDSAGLFLYETHVQHIISTLVHGGHTTRSQQNKFEASHGLSIFI